MKNKLDSSSNMKLKPFFIIFFFLKTIYSFGDTLKVHIIGYFFSGETYKIYYNEKIYTKKMGIGSDAFAFLIYIPDTIHDKQIINMHIYRKKRFGYKFRDIQLMVTYDDRRKYLILLRDNRVKKRYSLSLLWADFTFIKNMAYWEKNKIPKWAECDSIDTTDIFKGEPLVR